MANNSRDEQANSTVRVELGYCPRCGTLRAHLAGAAAEVCEACERILEWIRAGGERPLRRRRQRSRIAKGDRR